MMQISIFLNNRRCLCLSCIFVIRSLSFLVVLFKFVCLNTTISGVINGILANSVQNFFSRVLGSTVDVNFNYSRTLTNLTGVSGNSGGDNNFRENVSLQFIKSLMNDKLVITFGSDFNFATAGGKNISGITEALNKAIDIIK